MRERGEYPPLEAVAAVGDGRSMALLGPDARVEWFCPGRFDAAPAVWPLLDRARGGHLHIAPVDCVCTGVGYLPGTGVLRYEWEGSLGRARIDVAMRWPPGGGTQELLWLVEGLEGQVSVEVAADPQPGWGEHECHLTLDGHSAAWTSDGLALQLAGPVPLQQFGGAAIGNRILFAGQRWGVRLRVATDAVAPAFATTPDEADADLRGRRALA